VGGLGVIGSEVTVGGLGGTVQGQRLGELAGEAAESVQASANQR